MTLLFLGWLEIAKGIPELLEAVRRLVDERGPEAVRLLVAGEGAASSAARRWAAELGIADVTEFLGWVDRNRKAEILDAADIFVLPSRAEGMPNAMIEAMAAGLPVVVSPVGGVPDAVTDGVEGFLVPPGDASSLTTALGRLVDDSGLRRRMGRSARATAGARFRVEPAVDRLCDLVVELGHRSGDRRLSGAHHPV